MLLFILLFLAGDICLQKFSQLPSAWLVYSILFIIFVAWCCSSSYRRYIFIPLAFMLGLTWSFWYASTTLAWSLPKELEGHPQTINGYVISLPAQDEGQSNFILQLEQVKSRIKLSWRDNAQKIHAGDKWQLRVKLKRIHSTQNPGEFDYEAWALQKGIRATGYVINNSENKLLEHHWYYYPIEQIRQVLQEKIIAYLPASKTSVWLPALIIGERNHIAHSDWQVLRNTGTNHLMAIAGLHIGIISGLAHFIFTWCWRRFPRMVLRFPAQQAGACAALFVAISYSALAGFSIPTQRACIMLCVFIITLLLRTKVNAWSAWSCALFMVLLLNPLSIMTESLWLSFGTIALIIYGMSARLAPIGWWWKWGRVQWVIGFGLIPITLVLFQQCSLVSFLANSIAIPWLGFFILPFCFLSSIFLFIIPPLGGLLLFIADKSLALLWIVLTWFSQWHFAVWYHAMPNHFILLVTIIAFLFLLLPIGAPGRWLGLLWLLPLILFQVPKPQTGEIWMTLLDVGQGLSVVIQTEKHLLIYDTGSKLSDNFDMGESVVLPFLRTINAKQIDMLVISHGDNDHIGGANAVLNALPVKSIQSSVPQEIHAANAQYCQAGIQWSWDNVHFSFLYPGAQDYGFGNDSSCVLRIDNGTHAILLTGDIERYAEVRLLANAKKLNADILVAPHHGSKTSALAAFIEAVHPDYVLYAAGYRNRYHFPHKQVMDFYANLDVEQINTADAGAIFVRIRPRQFSPTMERYRTLYKKYWF